MSVEEGEWNNCSRGIDRKYLFGFSYNTTAKNMHCDILQYIERGICGRRMGLDSKSLLPSPLTADLFLAWELGSVCWAVRPAVGSLSEEDAGTPFSLGPCHKIMPFFTLSKTVLPFFHHFGKKVVYYQAIETRVAYLDSLFLWLRGRVAQRKARGKGPRQRGMRGYKAESGMCHFIRGMSAPRERVSFGVVCARARPVATGSVAARN